MGKRVVIATSLAFLLLVAGAAGWLRRDHEMQLHPYDRLLNGMLPVLVDIEVHMAPQSLSPKSTNGTFLYELQGHSKFFFTNVADYPVHIALPPRAVFFFNDTGECSPDTAVPDFASNERVLTLAPGEVIDFTDDFRLSVMDARSRDRFLRGGQGHLGFIFDSPISRQPGATYLAGTVFPQYTVVGVREGDAAESKRIRDARKKQGTRLRTLAE